MLPRLLVGKGTHCVSGQRQPLQRAGEADQVWPVGAQELSKRSYSVHKQQQRSRHTHKYARFCPRLDSKGPRVLLHQVIKIKSSGKVFVNGIESQLPLFKCELPKLNKATTSAENDLKIKLFR